FRRFLRLTGALEENPPQKRWLTRNLPKSIKRICCKYTLLGTELGERKTLSQNITKKLHLFLLSVRQIIRSEDFPSHKKSVFRK
ncbi:MAG: hypothetical protein ACXABY_27915, partial [Candidatus Thorarchaeota archaeon]